LKTDSIGLVKKFFDNTAQTYDKIVNLTTFGKDKYWKKEIIRKIPKCSSILDLACGTGILTFKIAEKFPDTKITGIDVTKSYLDVAKTKLKPFHKISFLLYDAEKLGLVTKFDCITSSYLPKYCTANILIGKCIEHLEPGGKIIIHDFTYPTNIVIRKLWDFYFAVLIALGKFMPNWKDVFENLPKLIKSTRWFEEYKETMEKHGLQVEFQLLTMGTSAILAGVNKI